MNKIFNLYRRAYRGLLLCGAFLLVSRSFSFEITAAGGKPGNNFSSRTENDDNSGQ
jgi:hypothetical protein